MVSIEQPKREAAKRQVLRNPQAFPTHPDGALAHEGMTLRDYFAAKAMQGIVAGTPSDEHIDRPDTAEWSYDMADAMLRARGPK